MCVCSQRGVRQRRTPSAVSGILGFPPNFGALYVRSVLTAQQSDSSCLFRLEPVLPSPSWACSGLPGELVPSSQPTLVGNSQGGRSCVRLPCHHPSCVCNRIKYPVWSFPGGWPVSERELPAGRGYFAGLSRLCK